MCYHYAMKETLSLRIEDSTKKELENLAKKMNRSVNNLLDTIIKEHLKQYEYKPSSEESDALYRAFIGKPFEKEKDK